MSNETNYHADDEKLTLEEVKEEEPQQKIQLPPFPEPLLDIPEELQKLFKYEGDMKDIKLRLKHKLMLSWILWGAMRNDEELIQIVNKEHDKGSDIFKVCSKVVNCIDQLARVLGCTDIMEEFQTE